ncbi:MAG: hypothetical protein ACKOZN_08615 [Cyanobium sp.]
MRTALDLDDELLAEAKAPANAPRPCLPVHAGRGGLSAAVADPCRNAALLDAADGLPPS